MGYIWPVRCCDDEGDTWVGESRSELVDLTAHFRRLIEMPEGDTPCAEEWRGVLPPNSTFVRLLGPRTAHVRVRGDELTDIAIRIDLPKPGPLLRITEPVVHSASHRRYLWAHRLRAVGIETTPRPLGYVEHGEHPALHKSFSVTEYILADNMIEFRDKTFSAIPRQRDIVLEKRSTLQGV